MDDLSAPTALEDEFGLAHGALAGLAKVLNGFGPAARSGRGVLYRRSDVAALMDRDWIGSDHPEARAVVVSPANWDIDAEATEHAKEDRMRQWWPVRDPENFVGKPLIVIASTMVVRTYKITGVADWTGDGVSFNIGAPDPGWQNDFKDKRIKPYRGPKSFTLVGGEPLVEGRIGPRRRQSASLADLSPEHRRAYNDGYSKGYADAVAALRAERG